MGVTLMILPYSVKSGSTPLVLPYLVKDGSTLFGWITFVLLLRRCSIEQNIKGKPKDKEKKI